MFFVVCFSGSSQSDSVSAVRSAGTIISYHLCTYWTGHCCWTVIYVPV